MRVVASNPQPRLPTTSTRHATTHPLHQPLSLPLPLMSTLVPCPTRLTVRKPRPHLHTNQHASDQGRRVWNEWRPSPSSCMFRSLLLLSLSVTSLTCPLHYLVTHVLSSCSLHWCTYRHSSTLMIKSETIDSISCCRVWQWEACGREQGREGRRERERGMNEDWEARVIRE